MSDAEARFRRLGELFDAAVTLDAARRAAFLTGLAGDDASLRAKLEAMLAADARGGLLDGAPHDLAAALPDAAPSLSGRQFGIWRLVDMLGRGGMGAVYRAERADGAFVQPAALKVMNLGIDSPAMRERFLRERQFLAALQHPNIATLLDGGVAGDGTPYLAMELVDGERIDAYCDERRLTVAARLRLMLQVFAAVQHAHQRLIVHRDLKPSNILVRADGTVKLLDFGIATVVDASGTAALTRDRPLTPQYAAPEQFDGAAVTTSTDVFALGVVLRDLAAGPVPDDDAACRRLERPELQSQPSALLAALAPDAAAAVAAARGTTPRTLARQLRGDLDTIVQRATAREPSRRYAGAQALATDVGLWLDGRPILARADSWLYRTRTFVRRNRAAVALALVAVAALVGATVFSAQQARRARAAAQDAEARALSLRAVSDAFDHLFRAEHFLPDANGAASAARLVRENLSAIDYFLADQPLTQASLLWRSGRALRLAGDIEHALPTLREATAAFAKSDAGTGLQGREATLDLARALLDSGDARMAEDTLAALERSLRPDEVNIDVQRHAIAFLRARIALDAGDPARAAAQIESALALAPSPSGERGARYGTTALLAGEIALAQGALGRAADRFVEALDALAADPHTELAPPQQPLAPVFSTLARLGAADAARVYAARWTLLREHYFGADSPQAHAAAALRLQLDTDGTGARDGARATRLSAALKKYWQATFVNYDITRERRPLSNDRDR